MLTILLLPITEMLLKGNEGECVLLFAMIARVKTNDAVVVTTNKELRCSIGAEKESSENYDIAT